MDIHRKPGYDPLELFMNPALRAPKLQVTGKLLRRKLGFRTLLDVIPLDTRLVRGSHGRIDQAERLKPVLLTQADLAPPSPSVPCTHLRDLVLQHLGVAEAL